MNGSRSQQAKKRIVMTRASAGVGAVGRAGLLLGKRDWDILVVKGPCR